MQKTALNIVKILTEAGFIAYFAGGYVRDLLLGQEAKDIDIVTDAKPTDLERLMTKTIPIGKQFGVMQVHEGEHVFEVATFRSDSGYSDGRRPDAVFFTNAQADAKRRDFTINGLFYDPLKEEIIDYVGGQKDLKDGILRFIGKPSERILEDKLRLLRAIRFRNELGLEYHPQTLVGLKEHAAEIINVSHERIRNELLRMFASPRRHLMLQDLQRLGILQHTMPEISDCIGIQQPPQFHPEGDVFEHILEAMEVLPAVTDQTVIWAVLLHDIGKAETCKAGPDQQITCEQHAPLSARRGELLLRRLRFPKKMMNDILWLVKNHMNLVQLTEARVARRRRMFLNPLFPQLLEVHRIDDLAGKGDLTLYQEVRKLYEEDKETILLPGLAPLLDGNDLMKEFNLAAGPKLKQLLELVHDAQLEEKISTKKEALAYLRKEHQDLL